MPPDGRLRTSNEPSAFVRRISASVCSWFATTTAVGTIDTINHNGRANQILGNIAGQIPLNTIPQFTDTVSTTQNIANFDPFEIIVDPRHNVFGSCHTYVYVQSNESNQVAIINSRNSVPVALISTPSKKPASAKEFFTTLEEQRLETW